MSDGLAKGVNDENLEGIVSKTSAKWKSSAQLRSVPARAPVKPELHVGQLGALSEEQLGRLLVLRPDLAEPTPASLAELEERCLELPSVYRALMGADVLVLQLAQILTLMGEKHAALSDVRQLVGDVPELDVERGLRWLEDHHLIVRLPNGEACVHAGLLMIRSPAALGPPAASLVDELSVTDLRFILTTLGDKPKATRKSDLVKQLLIIVTDPDRVRDLVAGAPARVRADARRMALDSERIQLPWSSSSDPYRSGPGTDTTAPPMWLVQRGLAYKDSWYTAVMPGEVGLALRGGMPFPATSYRRPQIAMHTVTSPIPSVAELRATAVIEAVERLVDAWGSKPAVLLKDHGIGVREVRRLAGVIDMAERETFRLIEMADAAGLIVADTRQALAMPTAVADEWSDLEAADRWWALALSWLETPMYPSLAGSTDGGTKPLPALGYGVNYSSEAAGQRRGVLRAVLELPAGHRADNEALAELAVWNAPMLWNSVPRTPLATVNWTLDEMELLGLLVDGTPSALASALMEGDRHTVRSLLAAPGAGTWQLILQTDLTALVSGRAPSSVRAEFELLADVEGRGSATLYRFTEASLRRAFDAGRSGEQILAFLSEHAAKGVPQPLEYLVGDVERRHGKVRLGRAGCYIRFEDPALAAEVARDKRTSKLGLRPIAPTVLVCDQPNDAVLAALRAAGYLPLVESNDGSAVHTPAARHRAEPTKVPGRASSLHSTTPQGSAARAVERWRSQLTAGSSDAASASSDIRTLAATLLRTQGQPPSASNARKQLSSGSHVEIPTLLRRPAWGSEEPEMFAAEVERLAEVLNGAVGELDEDGMAVIRDLLEMVDEYPGDADDLADDLDDDDNDAAPERPSDIFRGRSEIANLLEQALQEEWLVRLSYTSAAGRSSELTVLVLDVSDTSMLGQVAPRWTDQKYVFHRISWVRALTMAEEDLVW
jgi:hypothetical protein